MDPSQNCSASRTRGDSRITCLVCEEKIQTWRGDVRVELCLAGSRSGIKAEMTEDRG